MFVDSLFAKNLPKDIRGTLNGFYYFFGGLGIMFFSKLGGLVYDTIGHSFPFLICGMLDIGFAVLIMILWFNGKFVD